MKKPLTLFVICILLNSHLNAKTGLSIQANNNTSSIGNIGKGSYEARFNMWDVQKLKISNTWNNSFTTNLVMNKNMRNILLAQSDSLDMRNPSLLRKVGKESLYIGKQFLFGELCGVACSFLSAVIYGTLGQSKDSGLGSFGAGLTFVYLGYAFGNAVGVYWSGNNKQYQGSFTTAFAGSILGACLGFSIYSASQKNHTSAIAIAFGPIMGSIIYFNIFRKTRVSNSETFINYN